MALENKHFEIVDDASDLDSSDSDEECEMARFHKNTRENVMPWPWVVPTFYSITAGQLSDGTVIEDGDRPRVTHTYHLTFLQRVFVTFDYSSSSRLSFAIAAFTQCVIIISIVCGALEASPAVRLVPNTCADADAACLNDPHLCPGSVVCFPKAPPILASIDTICFAIFGVEYIIRFCSALFTPPRLAGLLRADWDAVDERERFLQIRKMWRDAGQKEAEKAKRNGSFASETQRTIQLEELRGRLHADLSGSSAFKNGTHMCCACGLHSKLTAIVMFLLHRPVTSTPEQLGRRQLEDFRAAMADWEEEFAQSYKRERGACCLPCTPCGPDTSPADAADPCPPTTLTPADTADSPTPTPYESDKALGTLRGRLHEAVQSSAAYLRGIREMRKGACLGGDCLCGLGLSIGTSTSLSLRKAFKVCLMYPNPNPNPNPNQAFKVCLMSLI